MTSPESRAETLTYTLDPMHSRAHFSIRHLMIARVRGEFTQLSGTVEIDPQNLTQLKVSATLEAGSFASGNTQRDDHVKSEAFLDVTNFPTLSFTSQKAMHAGNDTVQVLGDFNLHGVTKEITLLVRDLSEEITDPWGNLRRGATATTQIKRSDFGMNFNAPSDGGVMLSDEVEIVLDLEMTRKAD